jgi:hypothetical protein
VCVREENSMNEVVQDLDIRPVLTYSQVLDMYPSVWSWRGFLLRRLLVSR